MEREQVIFGFDKPKIHNVTAGENGRKPSPNKAAIKKGTGTLSVGEKLHLNSSPHQEDGDPYPGYSDEVRSWKKDDGTSPIIEHRWGYYNERGDRVELSNSRDEADAYHLGSYEDDGGCTPTLRLHRQLGSGRVKAWFETFVSAEENGGVEVVSPELNWYTD